MFSHRLKLFSLVLIVCLSRIFGSVSQVDFTVSVDDKNIIKTSNKDYNTFRIDGFDLDDEYVGAPMLPVKYIKLLIPCDKSPLAIEYIDKVSLKYLDSDIYIYPIQEKQILSESVEDKFSIPDVKIYETDEYFPKQPVQIINHGYRDEYHIVTIKYYPLQYNPVLKKVRYYSELNCRLLLQETIDKSIKILRKNSYNEKIRRQYLRNTVENYSDYISEPKVIAPKAVNLATLNFTELPSVNDDLVNYIIITSSELEEDFERIAEWKTQKGIPALIKTTSWIDDNYPGCDLQEKIRNFILDAYTKWDTRYFLLGGDVNIIPARIVWINESHYELPIEGVFMASDRYYSCLNGNWNADGDLTFGEGSRDRDNDGTITAGTNVDDVDLYYDVCAYRVSVENSYEANIYIDNYFDYINATNSTYQNNVLLFSANSDGISSSQMDIVASYFPVRSNIDKLYETYGDDKDDVLTGLNSGDYNIICGYGHGQQYNFEACVGNIYRPEISNLTNSPEFGILYNNHCYTCAFNYDCIAERYIHAEDGGGPAYIGYSSFGRVNDPSKYNDYFIDQVFNDNEIIGEAFTSVKNNYVTTSDNSTRYAMFALTLLAEPEMSIWTDTPMEEGTDFTVTYPANIYNVNQNIQVTVSSLPAGQEATVCLHKGTEDYGVGTTSSGVITFNYTPDTPGDIDLTVTSLNCIPFTGTINVQTTANAHIYAEEIIIDDDNSGASTGNDNEIPDAGETIELQIKLSNSGSANANGVTATLSCSSPYITINDNQISFGNINSSSSVQPAADFFNFDISNSCPDNELISMTMSITDNASNNWTEEFALRAVSPNITYLGNTKLDGINGYGSGDGDGVAEQYETIEMIIDCINAGFGDAEGVEADLSVDPSDEAYVDIIDGNIQIGTIESKENISTTSSRFEVELKSGFTSSIDFTLDISDDYGNHWYSTIQLDAATSVSNINAINNVDNVELYWDYSSAAKGYNIYRKPDGGSYSKINKYLVEDLGYYCDNTVSPGGYVYYYQVTCVDQYGNESVKMPVDGIKAWTEAPSFGDWPIMSELLFPASSPVICDVDKDGVPDILAGGGVYNSEGIIFGFNYLGEEIFDLDDNPTTLSGFYNALNNLVEAPIAVGDVDGDDEVEIVICEYGPSANSPKLTVIKSSDNDSDGEPDFDWDVTLASDGGRSAPTLADMDNDGDLDVLCAGTDGYVRVYDDDGSVLQSYHCNIGGNSYVRILHSSPLVIDWDNNPSNGLEVIVGSTDGYLYAWHSSTGTAVSGFPKQIADPKTSWYPYDVSGGILGSPVAGDIDNDGVLEVVVSAEKYGDMNRDIYIHFVELNATVSSYSLGTNTDVWNSPALGDVDGDGELEIVAVSEDNLYVFNANGTNVTGFPLSTGNEISASAGIPSIGDIDGDGDQEIVVGADNGKIYAVHHDGTTVNGWPTTTQIYNKCAPALVDLDNDGDMEVVVVADKVYIWDCDGTDYPGNIEWACHGNNSSHTSIYGKSGAVWYDQKISGDVYMNGDLVIKSGVEFELKAGTELSINSVRDDVRLGSYDDLCEIIIEDKARIYGTGGSSDKIVITSDASSGSASDWMGIRSYGKIDLTYSELKYSKTPIYHYSGNCKTLLSNCLLDHYYNYGVVATTGSLSVVNSTISNPTYNSARGLSLGTANLTYLIVEDNTFTGFSGSSSLYGILLSTSSLGTEIKGNVFNGFSNGSNRYAIYLLYSDDVTVSGNTIEGVSSFTKGVYMSGSDNCIIKNNTISYCTSKGLECYNSSGVEVDNNVLKDNGSSAEAIYFNGSSTSGDITYNHICAENESYSCHTGIRSNSYAVGDVIGNTIEDFTDLGIRTGTSGDQFFCGSSGVHGNNNIYWNFDDKGSSTGYLFILSESMSTTSAQYNYFGSSPSAGNFYYLVDWSNYLSFPESDMLLMYYKNNTGSGSVTYDECLIGNDGAIYGASWAGGVTGYALDYDGVNDYVDIGHANVSDVFNNSDDFTIVAWIYPESFPVDGSTIDGASIVGQRYGDNVVFGIRSDGKLFLNIDDTRGDSPKSLIALSEDEWQQVAVKLDNSEDTCRFYINGEYGGSGTLSDGSIDVSDILYIGWQSRTDPTYRPGYFDGRIDEVRIYNHMLTDDEVSILYDDVNSIATKSKHYTNNSISTFKLDKVVTISQNPFYPSSDIFLDIPEGIPSVQCVTLKIIGQSGELIRLLIDSPVITGHTYGVRWDGMNVDGKKVKQGIYYYEYISNNKKEIGKIMFVR